MIAFPPRGVWPRMMAGLLIFTLFPLGTMGGSEMLPVSGSALPSAVLLAAVQDTGHAPAKPDAPETGDDLHADGASEEAHEDHAGEHEGGHGVTHTMMLLVLQLGLIVIAAKICGEIFERFLKQPSVLGELTSGMILGPYALGPHLEILGSGPLFPLLDASLPVSLELYGIATIASIILLFMVGLETDFQQFMKYAGPGFAVGVGGVLGSFITGDLLYVWYAGVSFMDPAALFMGTVSTATSVGITARVLSEKKKLDSPEGTTILAGAVIDDVLGILILAVVVGVAAAGTGPGSHVDWGHIGVIAAKAFGFWLGATALGIALSARIAKLMYWFRSAGSVVSLGFGFALLLAGIAETFGLAMIIGAYIMGLSLSREHVAHHLERMLIPVYACFVPIFFSVMGMLVNFEAMSSAIGFGLIYSLVAIVSKTVGSALPALFVGFNGIGAARVGLGMLPRGEVALIVAGIGVSQGILQQDMFGVVIMMTLVTTVISPPGLVALFSSDKPGVREEENVDPKDLPPEKVFYFEDLTWTNHNLLLMCIQKAFESNGFTFKLFNGEADQRVYEMRGMLNEDEVRVVLVDKQDSITFLTHSHQHDKVRAIIESAHEDARARITGLVIKENYIG